MYKYLITYSIEYFDGTVKSSSRIITSNVPFDTEAYYIKLTNDLLKEPSQEIRKPAKGIIMNLIYPLKE